MPHSKISQARKNISSGSPADYKKFFDSFFAGVSDEDIALMDIDTIERVADSHWKMMQKRQEGVPLVKIYTPSQKGDVKGLPCTMIDIVCDDMAFLVDSIAAEIARHNRLIHVLLHPIVHFDKRAKGKLAAKAMKQDKKSFAQSHIHIELQSVMPDKSAKQLEQDLLRILKDVRFATRDWRAMREKILFCREALAKEAVSRKYGKELVQEYLEFLDYLHGDNFTLLGYREYRFSQKGKEIKSSIVRSSSLGLLSDEVKPVYISGPDHGLTKELQKLRHGLPPLTISKVNKKSTVHRPVPLDAVAVKMFDDKGNVIGESLFIGLFTSVTYSRSIQDIPYLRQKAKKVMALSGFEPGNHDYKALRHILEKYPRDELFQIEPADFLEKGIGILRLQERPHIALYTRPDPFGRYVSCLVYVPRERYDTRLRRKMQAILEKELNGECGSLYTTLDDSPLARVMCIIHVSEMPQYDLQNLEFLLQEAGRTWDEKLTAAMREQQEEDAVILSKIQKYGEAFSPAYQKTYSGKQALYDIEKIENVLETGILALDLYQSDQCDDSCMRLKLYHLDSPVILSDILPILENMGMSVISELPFEIKPDDGARTVWIHDFRVDMGHDHKPVEVEEIKEVFEEALTHIWQGDAENDSLNQLVIETGMGWRDIVVLRSYTRFLRQAGYPFGGRFIEATLVHHADIARHLVELFKIRHCPDKQEGAEAHAAACHVAIDRALDDVSSLDNDRILRSILRLVEATLRTNFYQKTAGGAYKPYLSLKLDSGKIDDLPKPRPYREIFVYAVHVEGVHLRGDKIARGGIRWSDRHEDFRTEILGLMKAQQVKNSLIVPMGAKGGFVVKNPPASGSREEMLQAGIACYKDFIRGLLDITDNRKGKRIVPPKNVVRHDEDDPYLVVAADKGTASFSDIANGLSQDYGFWLGDAFASGGSAGYDHKKMGITARGAWESVKRHFRELNHDTQTAPFDVVGVGDMGGDVFGNGMLLSPHIRMIGAFNHLHIFCDPDPDPESSFKERKRLFDNVAGWDSYDTKKLSKGGRIYSRFDKSLKLTPEICKRFDIEEDKVSPPVLIQAMLRARTDLLWFGGIGTYVKAKGETHLDVGDKANDSLRVNAGDVRARVIGEGANLAITQRARIEFSQNGGRINADFIDNSGGVDSSDHEVNIKILLADVMEKEKNAMTLPKRNKLLEKMTEEVAALVLRHNYQQAQAISLMEYKAHKKLLLYADLIKQLERKHGLSRELEALPDEEEIEKRRHTGKGLNRPEISTIQAYTKIKLTQDLLASTVPDQEKMYERLFDYFPTPLRKAYKDEILNHRLKREIIATMMAMSVVNRMGAVFVVKQVEKSGVDSVDVMTAYTIVQDTFGVCDIWKKLEDLDNKIPAQVQLKAMYEIAKTLRRETGWVLSRFEQSGDMAQDIEYLKSGVDVLRKNIKSVLTEGHRKTVEQFAQSYTADGMPEDLAFEVALMPLMGAAFDIIRASRDNDMDIVLAARVYFYLGEALNIDWLRRQARFVKVEDHWGSEAVQGVLEQLDVCQAGLTVRILRDMKSQPAGEKASKNKDIVKQWIENNTTLIEKTGDLFSDMHDRGSVELPMLIIAEQRLRSLYES